MNLKLLIKLYVILSSLAGTDVRRAAVCSNILGCVDVQNVRQARSIHHYKKLKIKVLKCNADIFFNKQCLIEKIIPNYANIKFPNT